MQNNKEERNISQALGSVPKVNFQRSFSATVTVTGTGTGEIDLFDIETAINNQNEFVFSQYDQMYIHEIRAYGTAGGYLSLAPFPHKQWCVSPGEGATQGTLTNAYERLPENFNRGSLTQMYEFGINGATRPELVWTYPKNEILNNPFLCGGSIRLQSTATTPTTYSPQACKVCTVQSVNTTGDALYIIQFDVTVRCSRFIPINQSLGAAAFGESNIITNNYKAPHDIEQRIQEANKVEELANKKRKVASVKALTLPPLDAK